MIFRNCDDVPFTMIRNDMLGDARMSWKAKGLLSFMLSRPKDWQFYEAEIVRHAKDGRDAVRSAVHELILLGYIIRGERHRNEHGQYTSYEYEVYGKPRQPYLSSKDGKSYVGKPDTRKKDGTNRGRAIHIDTHWLDAFGPNGERLIPAWETAKAQGEV